MASLSDTVIDMYGPLTYKGSFRNNSNELLATHWVPQEHQRRLRAYTVLSAYLRNMSRELLEGEKARQNRREYGDPWLLVETIVAAIMGEETTIMVDGAGATEGENNTPVNPDADAIQEWFDGWGDDEHPLLAITEGETDAVGLGDGVWEVTWDGQKKRPRVTVYDPGWYFPVLMTMEQSNSDFPTRIHAAWEFERWELDSNQQRVPVKYVRKITWNLVDIPGLAKRHPWNDEPTDLTCLKTDATWKFQDIGPRTAEDFDLSKATIATIVGPDGQLIEVRDLDLDLDFIPVVHLPNTIARKEHFGLSSLAMVLQILDDLQSADTDLALASRTTGTPPLWSKGSFAQANGAGQTEAGKKVTTYGPGQLFDGEVGIVDTSRALDALLKYVEFLLRRLSSNVQLPEASLGRLDPSKIDAGVIMSLSFGPLSRMVKKMRLVRDEKYPLLLKMVARTALKYQALEGITKATEMPAIRLVFGRFMPLDRAAVTDMAIKLFEAKLVSRLTAIKMLIEEAGLSIEEANEELERIEHEDFEGAGELADASDDINAARARLGLAPLPEDQARPQPPSLNLPEPEPGELGADQ